MVGKVLPNYLSLTFSSPNVSEDTNVTILPKKKLEENFLYLENLKSTYKHVLHCSHHTLSDVLWPFFCFSNKNTPASKNKEINDNSQLLF